MKYLHLFFEKRDQHFICIKMFSDPKSRFFQMQILSEFKFKGDFLLIIMNINSENIECCVKYISNI